MQENTLKYVNNDRIYINYIVSYWSLRKDGKRNERGLWFERGTIIRTGAECKKTPL